MGRKKKKEPAWYTCTVCACLVPPGFQEITCTIKSLGKRLIWFIHINSQPLSSFLGRLVSKTDVKAAFIISDIVHTEWPLTVFSNPGLERVSTFQGVNCGLEIKS